MSELRELRQLREETVEDSGGRPDFGQAHPPGGLVKKSLRPSVRRELARGKCCTFTHQTAMRCWSECLESYSARRSAAKTHACPCRFCRVIPSTWPLRIICAASIP